MGNKVMNALGLIQLGALLGALITSAVAWEFHIDWLLRMMF